MQELVDNRSLAEKLAELSEEERREVLGDMSNEDMAALEWDWDFWARANQLEPPGDWRIWVILAGRGFGKSRSGSEWIRQVKDRYARMHLVGATAGDVRDVMIEGDSGILKCSPKWDMPLYEPSKRRLTWPNGATASLFSAEEPERLRGPQCHCFWADEMAAWTYLQETWDNLMLGFRLGRDPRGLVTTTPKPLPLLRELLKDSSVTVTRGSTFDNIANLAAPFIKRIIQKYEGTRLGRQEVYGEVLEDIEGALWTQGTLDATRVDTYPDLQRVVVSIDPSVTDTGESSETGIIVAGCAMAEGVLHGYVLEDLSLRTTPDTWARRAIHAYHKWKADVIVGEVNNGGDMVGLTVRTIDPQVNFRKVTASRGKYTRAEPIAALYEQQRVHHVGSFPQLEDQMCLLPSMRVLTKRGFVPIAEMSSTDFVWTRTGWAPVEWVGQTGHAVKLITIELVNDQRLTLTPEHPVWLSGHGWTRAEWIKKGDMLLSCANRGNVRALSLVESVTTWISHAATSTDTTDQVEAQAANYSTVQYGNPSMDQYLSGITFITKTATQPTMLSRTCNWLHQWNTACATNRAVGNVLVMSNAEICERRTGASVRRQQEPASTAAGVSIRQDNALRTVHDAAGERHMNRVSKRMRQGVPVWNLMVKQGYLPEFVAEGILVHNCTWVPGMKSPDRNDSLVWNLTELMLGSQPFTDLQLDLSWGRRPSPWNI